MLFNCFSCGKTISTKKDICVYCKTDASTFIKEFNEQRKHVEVKEKHAGTLFSFLVKAR